MSEKTSYILKGPEDDYDIPKQSLGKVIYNRLRNQNIKDIINVDAKTKKVLTCGDFLEKSKRYCSLYKQMGVQEGDVISIISPNTVDYFVPVIAAFYIGVTINPVNPAYSTGELQRCLLIAQPKLIFASESVLNTLLRLKDEMELKAPILLINPESKANPYVKCADELLQENGSETNNFTPIEFDYTDQVALILFSSGTTGLPKGVMLTHQNLRMAIGLISHPKYGNVISGDVSLIVAPFYHIYGSLIQLTGLVTSTVSVVMNKFVPELFLETIQEYKVSKLYTVPSLLLFLSQSPLINNYNLSSVRDILVGGAPLSKELVMQIYKQQPSVDIKQMYGMTEVAGPSNILTDKNNFKSVGRLGPSISAKIVNPETWELLGPNEVGEICFKGPVLMKGYIPVQEYMDEDGFYKTGDAGYYDNEGLFYIVDRYKELIKYKGFQVPPAELESILLTHSAVKDCAVVGIPNERSGEVPLAFVVLKEGAVQCTEKEIVDFVSERISIQKRLYGGVRFVKEIPRNSNGKTMRRTLKEMI